MERGLGVLGDYKMKTVKLVYRGITYYKLTH